MGGVLTDDRRLANEDGAGYWLGIARDWGRHTLKLQMLQNRPSHGEHEVTRALGLGHEYTLSPRTVLYSSVTRFRNGRLAGVDGQGRFNAALPVGLTRPGQANLSEWALGLRLSF